MNLMDGRADRSSGSAHASSHEPGESGHRLVVTIDGPAGTGKSSVARKVAERLGLFVLDTGASHSSLTTLGLELLPGRGARATPSYRRVRTVGGSGVAVQEVRNLVMRCSEARFLQVALPVVDRGLPSLFPVHGVLGIDLLSRCRVTLDRGRVRLTAL